MLRRISHLALGRRSRWVVIALWIALAIGLGWLQPKLQTRAADESETFRARGAESTQVHQLLNDRFKEGKWSTATIAFQAKEGSIYERTGEIAALLDKICGTPELPDLVGAGSPTGVVCGEVGHSLGPQTPPSAFSAEDQPDRGAAAGLQRQGRHRIDGARRHRAARHPPGARRLPAGRVRHRSGRLRRRSRAGRRGHRRDAARDHGPARPRPDAAHLPLAADRDADAGRRGRGLPRRDRPALRPRRERRDDGQRAVDGDPDRADVRRRNRLRAADRLALSRRAAAHRRCRRRDRPRLRADRAGDRRLGRDRGRRDARAVASPTSTRRARWARSSRSASS